MSAHQQINQPNSVEAVIAKIYYSHGAGGFSNLNALYKLSRSVDARVTLSLVKKFLEKQKIYQLFKHNIPSVLESKHLGRRFLIGQYGEYAMDSFYLIRGHLKFGYCLIEMMSLQTYCRFSKKLNAESSTKALRSMLEDVRFKCTKLLTDHGVEYIAKSFNKFLEEKNIDHIYSKNSVNKSVYAEAAIGHIKRIAAKIQHHSKINMQPSEACAQATRILNETPSVVLSGLAPNRVREGDAGKLLMGKEKRRAEIDSKHLDLSKLRFSIGEEVRLKNHKGKFSKVGTFSYSSATYRIIKILRVSPQPLFQLKEVQTKRQYPGFVEQTSVLKIA
jgi:hypothetical protein